MAVVPTRDPRWKHVCKHHDRGIVWDTAVAMCAEGEEWVSKR